MHIKPMEVSPPSSPRISFSTDHLLDDKDFICTSPTKEKPHEYPDFEFLSSSFTSDQNVTTADELFFEGKLLPFQEMKQAGQKLSNIRLKEKCDQDMERVANNQGCRINGWLVDEDPSPKPPTCALLWKELFRLKKQRASSFSSYPSSSSSNIVGDLPAIEEGKEESGGSIEKHVKRIKKGVERTRRSATTRRKERF